MARLSINADIREIARQLDVRIASSGDPSEKLVDAALRVVEGWCAELGPAESFDELIEIVQAKTRVHFEVVHSTDELLAIRDRYLREKETGFIDLDTEFDDYTYAVVIKLQHAPSWANRGYVAVIDARGSKKYREWFSKWHELAHLIAEPQKKFKFRRTQASKRDPVERLMDQIAGKLAYYPPLLLPRLEAHGVNLDHPTLSQLKNFRDAEFPFASLQSAFIAVLQHVRVPAILVEACVRLKKSEQDAQRQSQLFSGAGPIPRLRAVTTAHNPLALRRRFYVHRWMRVPEESVIYRLHRGNDFFAGLSPSSENLSWWESDGEPLPDVPVRVEAMEAGPERVLALITPA